MRLADAWRPKQQHVVPVGEVASGFQLADERPIDRRLQGEVEVLQAALQGEVGDLGPHLHALLVLGCDLFAQHAVEEVQVAALLLGRVLEQGLQPVAGGDELEPRQVAGDPLELRALGHHDAPPATAA